MTISCSVPYRTPRELFEKIWFSYVKTIFIGISYLNNAHESASRDCSKNSTVYIVKINTYNDGFETKKHIVKPHLAEFIGRSFCTKYYSLNSGSL